MKIRYLIYVLAGVLAATTTLLVFRSDPPPIARAVERGPARRGTRPSAPRPTAPVAAAPVPPPAATPVPAPRKPDSLAVQVFRGEKVTQQKFEKPDSTKKKPQIP